MKVVLANVAWADFPEAGGTGVAEWGPGPLGPVTREGSEQATQVEAWPVSPNSQIGSVSSSLGEQWEGSGEFAHGAPPPGKGTLGAGKALP